MYVQPFLAATAAVFVGGLRSRRASVTVAALVACAVALQVPVLNDYVDRSINPIDLPNASEPDLLPTFRRVVESATTPIVVVSDNFAFEQLQGASAGEKQLFFVGRNLFGLPWKVRRFAVPTTKASGESHSARTSTPPGFSREDPARSRCRPARSSL